MLCHTAEGWHGQIMPACSFSFSLQHAEGVLFVERQVQEWLARSSHLVMSSPSRQAERSACCRREGMISGTLLRWQAVVETHAKCPAGRAQ